MEKWFVINKGADFEKLGKGLVVKNLFLEVLRP